MPDAVRVDAGERLDLDVAALLLRRDDLGSLHDVADDPHIAAPTIFERHRRLRTSSSVEPGSARTRIVNASPGARPAGMGARMLRPSGRVVVTTSPADAPAGQLTRTRRSVAAAPASGRASAASGAAARDGSGAAAAAAAPRAGRAAARGPLLARAARLRDAELGAGRGEHLDVRPREAQVRPQLVAHGGKGRDLGGRLTSAAAAADGQAPAPRRRACRPARGSSARV